MFIEHATYVAIPGTLIEQVDYQAISNLKRAIIKLFCLQVFLPISGSPLQCLNYLLLITGQPVGSHLQPLYFRQASQRIIEDTDADVFKHDLIKMVQPLETIIEDIDVDTFKLALNNMVQPLERRFVPITLVQPACTTFQLTPLEAFSPGSASSRRLLKSPSIVTLMLPLIFLIANFIVSLLDSGITPVFTAASRSATGYDILSPSPCVLAGINHLPFTRHTMLAVSADVGVTDDRDSSSTVRYNGDICEYFTTACYFSY